MKYRECFSHYRGKAFSVYFFENKVVFLFIKLNVSTFASRKPYLFLIISFYFFMEWLLKLLSDYESIAHLVVLYALVISLGVKLGQVKIGGKKNGIAFGATWVLFVGILVGHVCFNLIYADADVALEHQRHIIHVVKELGLILFVYCIGLQVGPSFFQTFKSGGLGMNLMTASLVCLNVVVMVSLYYLATALGIFTDPNSPQNLPMMVGVLYGACTNTPGLGAAQSVLKELGNTTEIANGYACAYPLGVVGIILSSLAIKFVAKVNYQKEHAQLESAAAGSSKQQPKHLIIKVTNTAIAARTLEQLRETLGMQFVVTRCISPDGTMIIPNRHTYITEGMTIHLVCTTADAQAVAQQFGEVIEGEWNADIKKESNYVSKRLVVTKDNINGKTLGELHFSSVYGVNVTRVTRNGMELFASRDLRLQIGDRLLVTGLEQNISIFKSVVGAHVKHLDHPNVGAIFFGILLGIIVGQIPIPIPGVTMPVKLGFAGGPLVMAILIGAFGYRFKINSYTSTSANMLLREVGIVLFLASVGIEAGAKFWHTISNGDGVHYVWMGFLITTVPIFIVGLIGRWVLKLNYFTLIGLIAGSNTDPPALAFANSTAGNNAPAVGYSTVYPLAMFLRILFAQLVLLFFLS